MVLFERLEPSQYDAGVKIYHCLAQKCSVVIEFGWQIA